jgi:hypothetical protein
VGTLHPGGSGRPLGIPSNVQNGGAKPRGRPPAEEPGRYRVSDLMGHPLYLLDTETRQM